MHELLKKLLEERARATGELRQFHTDAESRATDGTWTGEDQEQWARRNKDLDDLDARIKTIKDHADTERMHDEMRTGA